MYLVYLILYLHLLLVCVIYYYYYYYNLVHNEVMLRNEFTDESTTSNRLGYQLFKVTRDRKTTLSGRLKFKFRITLFTCYWTKDHHWVL